MLTNGGKWPILKQDGAKWPITSKFMGEIIIPLNLFVPVSQFYCSVNFKIIIKTLSNELYLSL